MKTVILILMLVASTASSQQSDTSSYFPLGLWGIWLDRDEPPYSEALTPFQWAQEKLNWQNINGNFLMALIPKREEDTIAAWAPSAGYRMEVEERDAQGIGEEATIWWWIRFGWGDWTYWTAQADIRLQGLVSRWANRHALYTYFLAHERPVVNFTTAQESVACVNIYWPRLQYAAQRLKQLDPSPDHKSIAVSGGLPQPGFLQAVPSLDILQMDWYVFRSTTAKSLVDQQDALQILLHHYNTTADHVRGRNTEWQAVIQSQEEEPQPICVPLRRPTFLELRAQAYLALTRGSRGIHSFVYGSVLQGGTIRMFSEPEDECDPRVYRGLVVMHPQTNTRRPWEDRFIPPPGDPLPFENIKVLYEELSPLGPTLRKLRHYEYFPGWTLQSPPPHRQPNIAGIDSMWTDYFDPVYLNYIEVGTFKRMDEGVDSTVYFILANRVCNRSNGSVSAAQTVSVRLNHAQSMLVSEVVSGEAWVIPPHGTFSTILDPGSGKVYRMEGAIISGTRTFPYGLTVPGGATLTVEEDAQLSFGPGTSLTVAGTLIVNGSSENMVTLSSTTPPNHWSGITVTGACNPTVEIEYAEISHAITALTVTDRAYCTLANSSVEYCDIGLQIVPSLANCPQVIPPKYVTNNTFSNVTLGISLSTSAETHILSNVITSSDVGISLSNPTYAIIDGNVVRENSIGISISGCGPVLHSNLIEDNSDYGVWVSDFADPRFGDMVSNDPGYNIIRNNNRPDAAQIVALTGFPFFGCHEEWCGEEMGGYNSIYYDLDKSEFRYAIEAREKSDILAHVNWWGMYPAEPGLFLADESSNIDYRFELDYDPNGDNAPSRPGSRSLALSKGIDGGGPSPMMSLTPEQRLLLQALGLRGRHQYPEALALYVQLILTRPLRLEALVAVSQLRNCYRDYVRNGGQPQLHEQLRQFLSTQSSGHSNPRLRTMAKFLLAQECRVAAQPQIAAQIFTDVAAANQNTPLETSALYSLFGVLAFDLGNREQAAAVFNTLETRYPTDPRTHITRIQYNAMLTRSSNASFGRFGTAATMQRTLSGLPKEFALHQNYPNPFNPTTRISFSLPEDVRTVLKVYDLLGREIQTLVDDFTKAGTHTINFDASRLASGMYLYRLQAGRFSQTRRLILLR